MDPPTLSQATGALNATTAPAGSTASTMMFPIAGMTGGVWSVTFTRKFTDAALPAASLAVHVTSVCPSGNTEPDRQLQPTVTGLPDSSPAAGRRKVTTAPDASLAATNMSAGCEIHGGVVSTGTVVGAATDGFGSDAPVSATGDCDSPCCARAAGSALKLTTRHTTRTINVPMFSLGIFCISRCHPFTRSRQAQRSLQERVAFATGRQQEVPSLTCSQQMGMVPDTGRLRRRHR